MCQGGALSVCGFARMRVSRALAEPRKPKSTKWWRCGRHSLPSYASLIHNGNMAGNIIVEIFSYYFMPFIFILILSTHS